jgi:16S rRNA C1402 (ribose-2'-O) methylase RsmI
VQNALGQLFRVFDRNKPIGVGRELTKAHEELVVRPIHELQDYFSSPKGEFTFLVPPDEPPPADPAAVPGVEVLRHELGLITESQGLRGRQALKVLAGRYGLSVNELYERLRDPDDKSQKP